MTRNFYVLLQVTAPYGSVLHNTTNVQFESGTYLACFEAAAKSHGNKDFSINIDWKTGIAAKDWDSIARKEKIEGVELELKKLKGAVEAIHGNLIYLRNREAEMRIVSEKNKLESRMVQYNVAGDLHCGLWFTDFVLEAIL
ncbi:unnamed protein product [Arabidopsis halleri]